jgi:hypothetical protein
MIRFIKGFEFTFRGNESRTNGIAKLNTWLR